MSTHDIVEGARARLEWAEKVYRAAERKGLALEPFEAIVRDRKAALARAEVIHGAA